MKVSRMFHQLSSLHNARLTYLLVMIPILLLGGTLRWGAFDEAIINADQSAILDAAFQTAYGRYFPAVGMKSSVGVMQTGIIPLLAAIPLLVVKRVIAVRWFFAALDFLALAWLSKATYKALGSRAALVTALLYATNPWLIEFSRTIWYQTLIATFATVALGCYLWVLSACRNRSPALTCALIGTTLMSMVHLAAAPWGMLLFAFGLFIAWRDKIWGGFWIGFSISGFLALPYLSYLMRTQFSDVFFLLRAGSEAHGGLNTAAYRLAGELLSGSTIVAMAHGDQWDQAIVEWASAPLIFLILLGFMMFITIKALVSGNINRRRREVLSLAFAWSIIVPAIFIFSEVHLQHFYLLHIFPAPLILIGAGIDTIFRRCGSSKTRPMVVQKVLSFCGERARRWSLRVIGYALLSLTLSISLWWASLWLVRIRLEAQGQLQRTTRAWLMDQAAITVNRYLETMPDGQVIVLVANTGDVTPFDWIRAYTQRDAVRVTSAHTGLIIPPGPTCYLLGPGVSDEVLASVASQVDLNPTMTIPANPPWPFYCGAALAPSTPLSPIATWRNGMRLLKAEVRGSFAPNETLYLTYTWHYHPVERHEYHIFNHLLLAEEETLVAQIDGPGVPTKYWRADDILMTQFQLHLPDHLPAGDYHLLTGAYTWPQIERVFLTDGSAAYQVQDFVLP